MNHGQIRHERGLLVAALARAQRADRRRSWDSTLADRQAAFRLTQEKSAALRAFCDEYGLDSQRAHNEALNQSYLI